MANPLPAGWTEHFDQGSGRAFFHNATTGETAWERPGGAAPAAGGGLPEGWAEHTDPGSGRVFYYKAATGETSWEKPAAPAAAAAAPGALPEGWTEHLDAASGKTFYYHAAKGETSWDRPAAAAATPAPAAAGALPEGWAEHTDPASGRTFYCKTATGETSWDRPAAPAAAASLAPLGSTFSSGTWSTAQANDLGKDPQPPMHVLQQKVEVLSSATGGQWSSVARVIDALNGGVLNVQGGLCVIFSASKDSYWLLWRSDKEKEAENIIRSPY